jgi:hypothetical protein
MTTSLLKRRRCSYEGSFVGDTLKSLDEKATIEFAASGEICSEFPRKTIDRTTNEMWKNRIPSRVYRFARANRSSE